MITQFRENLTLTTSTSGQLLTPLPLGYFMLPVTKPVRIISISTFVQVRTALLARFYPSVSLDQWVRDYLLVNIPSVGFPNNGEIVTPAGTLDNANDLFTSEALDTLFVGNSNLSPKTIFNPCSNVRAKGLQRGGFWYRSATSTGNINLEIYTTIEFEDEN